MCSYIAYFRNARSKKIIGVPILPGVTDSPTTAQSVTVSYDSVDPPPPKPSQTSPHLPRVKLPQASPRDQRTSLSLDEKAAVDDNKKRYSGAAQNTPELQEQRAAQRQSTGREPAAVDRRKSSRRENMTSSERVMTSTERAMTQQAKAKIKLQHVDFMPKTVKEHDHEKFP